MIQHNGLVYSVLMERKRIVASFISTPLQSVWSNHTEGMDENVSIN